MKIPNKSLATGAEAWESAAVRPVVTHLNTILFGSNPRPEQARHRLSGFSFPRNLSGEDQKALRTVNRGRLSAPARSLSGETGCESLDPNGNAVEALLTSGGKTRRPAMGVKLTSARKGRQEGDRRKLAPKNRGTWIK